MDRRLLLCSLLFLPVMALSEQSEVKWLGPDQPVYVVTQNHYAEGFTLQGDTPKFGDLIAIEIFSPKPRPAGVDAVYKAGERLALFIGGQKRGDITINKTMPFQCDSSAAVVTADPSVHLQEGTMALATNAAKIRSHANIQRQPDDAERKSAQQLALSEFRKHGLAEGRAKDIEVERLVVTRLDHTEDNYLIGSFFVEAKGVRHELFLLAPAGSSANPSEFVRYHQTTDLQDGTDVDGMRFVDQLDLDGDGTDEIVIEMTGYESEAFAIYKLRNHRWIQVHVGGGGGC